MGDFGPDLPTSRMSANAIRHTVLEGTQHFSRSWLRENVIHVLPREEITELPSSDELRFLAKLSDELICITTADIGEQSQNQAVQIPVAQVSDWFWDHASFDVLIATPDLHALLLITVDEYALLAGSRQALATAITPQSLDAAHAQFDEYAADMASASRHLRDVAQRYGRPERGQK